MRKATAISVIALLFSSLTMAEAPKDYYTSANGKCGNELRLALQEIIDFHQTVSYDNLYKLYVASDSHDDGSLWDMYSTCTWTHQTDKCGSYSGVCSCYNREHSVPQSWFSGTPNMKSDAFHVVPTDGRVNGQRSNYAFGECAKGSTLSEKALGKLGTCTFPKGYSGKVFEPADEYKGDFARSYFYIATRYAGYCETWHHQNNIIFSNEFCGLTQYGVDLLLKWHRQDPVSEKERIRNDVIYGINNNTGFKQGNRNPFIDYPCLAEYIWGDNKTENVDFSRLLSSYDEQYINGYDKSGCNCVPTKPGIIRPLSYTSIDLGTTSINTTATTDITIQGVLLTQAVDLSIIGTNASMFAVSASKFTAQEGLQGITVRLEYTPTAIGDHKASLKFTSTEFDSFEVYLTGHSKTTLVSPVAHDIVFNCIDADKTESTEINVLATNVSSNITLSIEGTHANRFELSETTIKPTDAQNGKTITLTYAPLSIGTHNATLKITSKDFTSRTIPLIGITTFEALEASEITHNSFAAHWTNAGVSSYTLDVFKKDITESTEKVILDITNITASTIIDNKTVIAAEGKIEYKPDGIKLGSSSGTGKITINGDFTSGGTIALSSKYYSHDDMATIKVTHSGNKTIEKELTDKFAAYEFIIEPTNTPTVTIEQGVSDHGRFFINHIKVTTGKKKVEINRSITGYPKNVGNVTSYIVNNLTSETNYYYTVTPLNEKKSNEIKVNMPYTETNNELTYENANQIVYYTAYGTTILSNLQPGKDLDIYNSVGQHIMSLKNIKQTETLSLKNGIYIIRHNGCIAKIIVQ